jgi:hypothetical protein
VNAPASIAREVNRRSLGLKASRDANEEGMSPRYLLLLIIVLYVVFALFVPAMQNLLGYGFGTLVALVILWYVFVNRSGPVV